MDESILISVKKMLGIDSSYNDFDPDVIMSINSAIHTLYQVGYEPAKNFIVESTDQTWSDFSQNGEGVLSLIKTYIYTKVRMLFDPPTSSFVLTSLENQTKELEWRIYAEMEGGFANDEEDSDIKSVSKYDPDRDGCQPERHHGVNHVRNCSNYSPWDGVPSNGPDLSEGPSDPELSDALRRLRNEMGRP